MATRQELMEVFGERYRQSGRQERSMILDEFVSLAGYHRKYAIRVLMRESKATNAKGIP